MTEPLPALKKTIRLPLPAERAFDLFIRDLPRWWPVESHSLSAREGHRPLEIRIEPCAGGRITELRHDGEVADWAELTAWETGRRLELAWHVGRARSHATRIDLRFDSAGPNRCEVTLIHSGFDVLGPAGEAARFNYDEGWDMVLGEHFRQACEDLADA